MDDELIDLFGGVGILEDLIPGLQYVWKTGKMKRLKAACKAMIGDYIGGKFLEHKASIDKGTDAPLDITCTYMSALVLLNLINELGDPFFALILLNSIIKEQEY